MFVCIFLSSSSSLSLLSPKFAFDHILDFCVSHFLCVHLAMSIIFNLPYLLRACVCFFIFGVFLREKKSRERERDDDDDRM